MKDRRLLKLNLKTQILLINVSLTAFTKNSRWLKIYNSFILIKSLTPGLSFSYYLIQNKIDLKKKISQAIVKYSIAKFAENDAGPGQGN